MADDQRGVRPPGLGGVELLQPRLGLLQRGARLLANPQPLHEVEDAGVGAHVLRELVPVPAGQVADELAALQRRADGPPRSPARPATAGSLNFTSAFSPTQARSAQSAMSSCVISSTTSQSSFCALPPRTYLRAQWSAVCAPRPRFCAEQCVLDTRCTASPCSRSLGTVARARCVFPVPGRPVSSRELPARQWLIGSSSLFYLRGSQHSSVQHLTLSCEGFEV